MYIYTSTDVKHIYIYTSRTDETVLPHSSPHLSLSTIVPGRS